MRALAPIVALVLLLGAPARAADSPVLGSPEFYANGVGFGKVAPRTIHNGGDPSGYIGSIRWTGWGRTVAHGVGRGNIFRPMGGYYPPVRVKLRVRGLGSWFKWSGTHTMCSTHGIGYGGKVPGACGRVGKADRPGTVESLAVFRIDCARARRVASAVHRWDRPAGCERTVCRKRILGLKCVLHPVHRGDEFGFDHPHRSQRLACRDGAPSLSAFLVLNAAA
jgi:hypothetical protein